MILCEKINISKFLSAYVISIRKICFSVAVLFPLLSFSTHIAGGVLNYAYNGGNVYTITLKLYRDCGPSTAGLPGNVTIKIRGNAGATFSTSLDLTLNLGTVTNIPANLLPCASPPNPMPCVQEGVYTKTISLAPNLGGYHLYYQVVARDVSISNINSACNCIGESFYAFIPSSGLNASCSCTATSNSNPVFNSLPPLFLCAGQSFTFNHSASDADGDSLVYSLYAPYNGYSGSSSAIAPTYSSNVAYFTNVNYVSGYSANSPLGSSSPFSIHPATGVITATPSSLGAFVVGVKVKEYRNGVFLSETIRDFQYNVINCPSPPPTLAISNMTMNASCSVQLNATGITSASAVWNSIAPGVQGAYNSYLTCNAACLNPSVSSGSNPPSFIDFKVCGTANNCLANTVCDTFRVYFNSLLTVSISPVNPALCNGQTSTTITAYGSGGTPPYSFLWNNVNPTQSVSVGAGTYNVKLTDASACPAVYNSVVVNTYSVPVNANAGVDQIRCKQNPIALLNATVVGATGGVWSGGSGTMSPNNTALTNMFYTPSLAELTAGSATLFLTTTGSGNCPPDKDTVVVFYTGFTGTVALAANSVSCYGGVNGNASVSVIGGFSPHTFTWNTLPIQTGFMATNLSIGIYSLSITNSLGCTSQATVQIGQPLPLALNSTISNVSCFSLSNGSINVAPYGGTAPYTYSLFPLTNNTPLVGNLAAGVYTSVITDNKGCSLSSTLQVTQPASLSISITQSNVSCFNGNNGLITSSVSGGTPLYTYSWSPGGATSYSVSNLTAGNYILNVKDQNNCSSSRTVSVLQPLPLTVSVSVTNETCNYLNNGSANSTVSGGNSGYTYLWMPGSIATASSSNLSSNNYTLTVSDAKACNITTIITVAEPTALNLSFTNPRMVSCFGGSNGSVTANVSGGTASYNYTWSPGNMNSANLTNAVSGIYTLSVRDNNFCLITNTVLITQPTSMSLSVQNNSVSCYNGNNASLSFSASGGISPYNYLLFPAGQNTSIINGLTSGVYTSLVLDANSCSLSTTHTIVQPASVTVVFTKTNVTCFNGLNGAITSSVVGGNAPYLFNWNAGLSTQQNIYGLQANNYTLLIIDANNCATTNTINLSQPTAISLAASFTNESCNYLNNGSASIIASGGISPYTFFWTPGSFTNNNVSNLSSGTYSIYVTDLNGCSSNTQVTISEPQALVINIVTYSNVTCYGGNNGFASVMGNGGTPNYNYTWMPGNSNNSSVSGLLAGTYSVFVSDNQSCLTQTTLIITQASSISVLPITNSVTCFGGSNGSCTLYPTGGNAPYTFFWLPTGSSQASIASLSSGIYTFNVHDAKNCNYINTVSITQSSSITIAMSSTNVSCFLGNNGAINSTVTGGASPYSFNWNASVVSSQGIAGVSAGTHSLTVVDANGCLATKTIVLTQSTPLSLNINFTNETCDYLNNGSASATLSGGVGPYTYSWQPVSLISNSISNLAAGSYTLIAKDVLGCSINTVITIGEPTALSVTFTNVIMVACNGGANGSVGAIGNGGTPNYSFTWNPGNINSAVASNLSQGVYTVVVTDQKACQVQNTFTVTQPPQLNLIPTISNVTCGGSSNGAISLLANGGISPYSYILMPGNINGANFNNLQPGIYSITATDANTCSTNATISITNPISISSITSFSNSTCLNQNGIASVSVTGGGTPPFAYNWLPSGGTGATANNLGAGSYSVTITDANGCSSVKVVNVTDLNAPTPSLISYTNISCNGGMDGAIQATITGGSAPYTYTWSALGGSTTLATGLVSGFYNFKVTDNVGCIGIITSSVLSEPSPLITNITKTDVSCFGGNNATACANVSGGTGGYTYLWISSSLTTNSVSNLSAGQFILLVNDANQCVSIKSFTINEPSAPLSLTISSTPALCFNASNGSLSYVTNGGTAFYSYTTQPGNIFGNNISNLSAGIYSVLVKDLNQCTLSQTVSLTQPQSLSLTTSGISSDCGLSNGQVLVNVSGGTAPYNYFWNPSSNTNSVLTSILAGNYSVLVSDANSCTSTSIYTLTDNPAPTVTISSFNNVTCFGLSNGAATASVIGGIGPFTYSWLPAGGINANTNSLSIGVSTVQVISSNGCTVYASTPLISQPAAINLVVSTNSIACFGSNTGAANANVYGGSAPYVYQWLASSVNSSVIVGLPSANYSINVIDSFSCTQSQTFTINQPLSPLSVSVNSSSVSCYSASNGSVTANASGGTAPYNYLWLPGNYSGQNLSNLSAGIYTVNVTDANGCNSSATVNVSQPTALTFSINTNNSNCSLANGSATAIIGGGIAPYTYSWSAITATTFFANNLMAGQYALNVADANACLLSIVVTVSDNPAPTVSVIVGSSVTCYGGANGSATVVTSAGTGPFLYQWLPSNNTTSLSNNLSAGNHTVSVISANSCTVSATSFSITQPSPLLTNMMTTSVSCYGGNNAMATVLNGGGTAPYSYTWSAQNSGSTSISNLSAGTYSLLISDNNNCSVTQTFVISQPTAAISLVTTVISSVSCFGFQNGMANVTSSGGTPNYSYNWLPFGGTAALASSLAAGIYSVNVTDANGCANSGTINMPQPAQALGIGVNVFSVTCHGGANGSITAIPVGGTAPYFFQWLAQNSTQSTLYNLTLGNYSLNVSDANNCQSYTNVAISEPSSITASLNSLNPACSLPNGNINSVVSGGVTPYFYTWLPFNSNSSSISGLQAGSYTLQITDSNACIKTVTTQLTNQLAPHLNLVSTKNISCFGGNNGSGTVAINLGTAPFNINWAPFGGNSLQTNSLIANVYTVNVSDARGCVDSLVFSLTEPSPLSVTIQSLTNVSCFGGNNASVTVQASGGTSGYTYQWTPMYIGNANKNISAGNYTVQAKDAQNCSQTINVQISQPNLLSSTIQAIQQPLCYNGNGFATITVMGGTAPYTYTWSSNPSQNSNILQAATAGHYNIWIKDSNGCSKTDSLKIVEPTQVITKIFYRDTVCFGKSDTLKATANGGAGGYYYVWQPGAITNNGSLVKIANSNVVYTVSAFDQNGCSGKETYAKVAVLNFNASNLKAYGSGSICPGLSTAIYAETYGNTGKLNFLWNENLGTQAGPLIVKPSKTTYYSVKVSNSCGASVSDSVRIDISTLPIAKTISDTIATCNPGNIKFYDQSISTNTQDAIISWKWDFGDGVYEYSQDANHTYNNSGTYSVTLLVTTDLGCTNKNDLNPTVISVRPKPLAAFELNKTTFNLPYEKLICTNLSEGAVSYTWQFGNESTSTLKDPKYLFQNIGKSTVQLIAKSEYACVDTVSIQINAISDFVFPNAFTPNINNKNNGYYDVESLDNDVFFPYTSGVTDYLLQIYDRWGELIFESQDLKLGWNGFYKGVLCQSGVYVWKVDVTLSDGRKFNQSGTVSLIR